MVAVQGVPARIEVLGTQITNRFALRLNGGQRRRGCSHLCKSRDLWDRNEKPKEKRFPLNMVDAPDLVCPMPTEYFKEST